jgi:hypothetical protein
VYNYAPDHRPLLDSRHKAHLKRSSKPFLAGTPSVPENKPVRKPGLEEKEKQKEDQAQPNWDFDAGDLTDSLYPILEDGYFMFETASNILHLDDSNNRFMQIINYFDSLDEDSFRSLYHSANGDDAPGDAQAPAEEDYETEKDRQIQEIINDLIEEDRRLEFEEDMADCECCRGYIHSCQGAMCKRFGVCQCFVQAEMENEYTEHFIAECVDCECCQGYVYTCLGRDCKPRGSCSCFALALEEEPGGPKLPAAK